MKRSSILLGVFVVVALIQMATPLSRIWSYERTLREGRAFKFRTAPVDPYDAFRGRYVALRFEQDHALWHGPGEAKRGATAFAAIREGPDGFARVDSLVPKPPAGDHLRVKLTYPGWGTNAGQTSFTMPFDRYYMEEHQAPAAERAYWQQNRWGNTNRNTYAVVRVRAGLGVIEDLCVDGQPIRQYLAEHPAKK